MAPSRLLSDDEVSNTSIYDFDEQEELVDGTASRKRRKLSPEAEDGNEESDSDADVLSPAITSTSAQLSRVGVKRKAGATKVEQIDNASKKDEGTSFATLNVSPWLVSSLAGMAIRRPTGIQKGCIPEILKGRDCIGGSRTGSGKTVAFAVPILQKWAEDPVGIFALVLTPTRYVFSTIHTSTSHADRLSPESSHCRSLSSSKQ